MNGIVRVARGPVRWYLTLSGYGGITLPPWGIYILANRVEEERLVRHEQAHWAQYERMGALRFYATYCWYTLRYGYWGNPMEVEARKAEGQSSGT